MTLTTLTEKIVAYFEDNAEELVEIARELNSWDGSFDEFNVHSFDEDFFEMMFAEKPYEAARATHFGEVNWSDDYIRFNGYGNLESLSDWDLEKEAKDRGEEIVEAMLENLGNLSIPDEVQELIDEDEEEEEDEE